MKIRGGTVSVSLKDTCLMPEMKVKLYDEILILERNEFANEQERYEIYEGVREILSEMALSARERYENAALFLETNDHNYDMYHSTMLKCSY